MRSRIAPLILLAAIVQLSCGDARRATGLETLEIAGQRFVRPPGVRWFAAVHELTCANWVLWLQAEGHAGPARPGFAVDGRGRWSCARGTDHHPVAHLTQEEAWKYCAWFSRVHGVKARLPTEAEWESAARGGLEGARYSWGWEPPAGRARFGSTGPQDAGGMAPNRFGLHDTCGSVWEWCAEPGVARGGAWSERDERWVSVEARHQFGADYRDADAGFRLWIEPVERSGR